MSKSIKTKNPMRNIRVEKVVLNIGCGRDGNLEHAQEILKRLTRRNPHITKTIKRSTFGVGKGKNIGVMITLRENTEEILKRLFEAVENQILIKNFDDQGNFSFGIKEYLLVPGMEYDPKIGVMGFDVSVRLERPGYSVKKKALWKRVGKKHVITKEEAIEFVRKKFGIDVLEERRREEY